jgi:hypothetical protein
MAFQVSPTAMFELLTPPAPNVIAYRLDGKVDSEVFGQLSAAINAALEQHEQLRLYAEVDHLGGVTPEAIVDGLGYVVRRLSLLHRFDRAAIVSDEAWVRKVGELKAQFFSSLEIRAFPRAEREAARAWIAEGAS